jgi:hypothetical protein
LVAPFSSQSNNAWEAFVRKLRVALLLGFAALGMAGSLSACVVEEGHGWRHEHRDWR